MYIYCDYTLTHILKIYIITHIVLTYSCTQKGTYIDISILLQIYRIKDEFGNVVDMAHSDGDDANGIISL